MPTNRSNLAFSVDTHLLQELGALLVGRDSTAVVELIKNAYDADASAVTVHGEALGAQGLITITDNGHGMTETDFVEKFLRIAGRSKEGGNRRSPMYARRFTGAKGIGRLSAHKLGAGLRLTSIPNPDVLERSYSDNGFTAYIDWQAIEQSDRTIENARDITIEPDRPPSTSINSGTLLTINRLHGSWTTTQLNRFLAEVRSTRPDSTLVSGISERIFPGPHLFSAIPVSDSGLNDPGFEIELSGDFAGSETQWPDLIRQMNWMIEIDATSSSVRYRVTPSLQTVQQNPTAESREFDNDRKQKHGPRFRARVFVRDGSTVSNALRGTLDTFAKDAAGIRVYSEGFRVLPYGSARNDWLGIDADYTRRSAIDVDEDQLAKPTGETNVNERVYARPGSAYFGGVFLHDATSHGLEMVVNREGFLPNEAFEEIQTYVRKGVELSVRVRAAVGQARSDRNASEKRQRDAALRSEILAAARPGNDADADADADALPATNATEAETPRTFSTKTDELGQLMRVGSAAAANLRHGSARSDENVKNDLKIISVALDEARSVLDATREEQSQLRVLASIGTQMGAFIHEVNGVLGQARTIRDLLQSMIDGQGASRASLRQLQRAQDALITALERQAVYLADSLGAEARRRRRRQNVRERIATAFRLLGPAAVARGVTLTDDSDPAARTLPMFAAELNVVLTNLLSNAIKAASDHVPSGHVRITTSTGEGNVIIRVSNNGTGVDLNDAERWFQPFESTTSEIDTTLGQGLGLGLPLTRRIVEEYGGHVQFVEPEAGMATSVDLTLPTN